MSDDNEKKGGCFGIFIGPIAILIAVTALWKNEGRFDFHRAAKKTTAVASSGEGSDGQLISLTGPMDQSLTMAGKYVENFEGYLQVHRRAEIYCWDKEKRDDKIRWDLEWQSSVESNSRNRGVKQQLSSGSFMPPEYHVGELEVAVDKIEFVDSSDVISPSDLTLTEAGTKIQLQPKQNEFYLSKGKGDRLGDERITYSGIPVPAEATYFGKLSGGRGVAHQAVEKSGFVDAIIQDTGVLHHLVAGDRCLE